MLPTDHRWETNQPIGNGVVGETRTCMEVGLDRRMARPFVFVPSSLTGMRDPSTRQ
jgi:hypothetical protein